MKGKIPETERYNLWTKFFEEYKNYFKTIDEIWYEKFEEVKMFINNNNKKPSESSNNEKHLYSWINEQNKNYKTKKCSMNDPEKYNLWTAFLQEYKEHFKTIDEIWYEKFEEVKIFIETNKKRPSNPSSNKTEQKLGVWIANQNKNYKTKKCSMNDPEKYNLWTKFLEEYQEYFKTIDELWHDNFEKLKIFIDTNKRQPSKNSDEKLSKWLGHQNFNYKHKEHSMNDPEKYNLWTTFLEEYAQYMTPNPITESSDTSSKVSNKYETTFPKPTPKKKSMKLKPTSDTTQPKETTEQTRQRTKSEMSVLHQRYKTLTSQNLRKEFTDTPELWHKYHEISEENEKTFPEEEIPRNRIIQEINKIKTKRTKLVVDMGCGKAQIANHFQSDSRFKFVNYDHVSSIDTVVSCDISNIPLEGDSVDICILSLAMWGHNCQDYVKEAHRILETGGRLYIIEATKRWSEKDEMTGLAIPGKEASRMKTLLAESGFSVSHESVEKFCLFVCSKN
jgi:hypothetical protein